MALLIVPARITSSAAQARVATDVEKATKREKTKPTLKKTWFSVIAWKNRGNLKHESKLWQNHGNLQQWKDFKCTCMEITWKYCILHGLSVVVFWESFNKKKDVFSDFSKIFSLKLATWLISTFWAERRGW